MPTGIYTAALTASSVEEESWVHMLPAGRFSGRDGRGPWVIEDADQVIAATRQHAGKNQLAIDYEHQTDNSQKNGQPAPAAGWIKGLKNQADGIWALVDWTESAANMIHAKEYRYLSPVFNFEKGTGKVIKILRAAVTNNPALELTALARAEEEQDAMNEFEEFFSRLRVALSLGEDADPEMILERIKVLADPSGNNSTETVRATDPEYVPIGDYDRIAQELEAVRQGHEEETIQATVSSAIREGRLLPALQDAGLALCRSDRSAFDTLVGAISPFMEMLSHSQTGGKPPSDSKHGGSLSETQLAICNNLGQPPETYAKNI